MSEAYRCECGTTWWQVGEPTSCPQCKSEIRVCEHQMPGVPKQTMLELSNRPVVREFVAAASTGFEVSKAALEAASQIVRLDEEDEDLPMRKAAEIIDHFLAAERAAAEEMFKAIGGLHIALNMPWKNKPAMIEAAARDCFEARAAYEKATGRGKR